MSETFYTYLWLRERWSHDGRFPPGSPYYIGKGKGDRAYDTSQHRVAPPNNHQYILIQEFPDEISALEGEKWLIAIYGRVDNGTGCLINLTDGGEGLSGHTFSTDHRSKIAATKKDKKRTPFSQEWRANISKALIGNMHLLGHKHSDESKRMMSASNKGRIPWNKGISMPLEIRRKLGTAVRAGQTEDVRKRMSISHTGKKHTPEDIIKMKAAQSIRRSLEREQNNELMVA